MTQACAEELLHVQVEHIRVNPYQPRRHFSDEELQELAESIRSIGILHPPTVRRVSENLFEIISGERRYRASQLAGLSKIPVIVRLSDVNESAQAALIENVQRVDLDPIEVAKALRRLMEEFGYGQEEVAKKICKKRSTVANYLRLLALPSTIQGAVSGGQISMGHAKVILSLNGIDKKMRLYEAIIASDLTVRDTERAAQKMRGMKTEVREPVVRGDIHLMAVEAELQGKLGTKVNVLGTAKKGKLQIEYHSLDDLNRILEFLM